MVNKLRELIAQYITQNGNIDSWEEIRSLYSIYTYVSFLVIALKYIDGKVTDIKNRALDLRIENEENIEWIFSQPGSEKLAKEVAGLINDEEIIDINGLYQDYLSVDFSAYNNQISFSGGKNSRDTLGSYYTQEDFAYEISKKAIEEYIKNCSATQETIRVIDFSCGGGAFLLAAKKICDEKEINVDLFGVDVDPIAIMITKTRLVNEHVDASNMHISLGNPLLRSNGQSNSRDSFVLAIKGRYYNSNLGIDIYDCYDIAIGNPPWEKIRFEEKKFLSHYVQSDLIDTKKNREKCAACASEENRKFYSAMIADYENAKNEIKKNDEFQDTRVGELNTYALFTEYALNHISNNGIVGLIVKSSLLKMPVYSEFMKHNMSSKNLFEVYMFVNRRKIFNIDSREEFSVVYYKRQNKEDLQIAVNIEEYKGFFDRNKIGISCEMLDLLNPETSMLPNISNNEELKFLCNIYSHNPAFGEKYKDCRFGRLVHLTNHSQHILRHCQEGYLPIYEGKFIELYTGKYATFKDMNMDDKYKSKATARTIEDVTGEEYPESRYYIDSEVWNNLSKNFNDGFVIAWRSLTSATNRRTMIATVLPLVPTCQSIQLLQMNQNDDMIQILALFNSIIFDYIVRLKMAGLDLTQTIVKQIPVPSDANYETTIIFQEKEDKLKNHIASRLNILYADDIRVSGLFDKYYDNEIVDKPRKQVIAELDSLVGCLYGLSKDEIRRIAKTFHKYYTKEEVEQWF